MLYLQRKLFKKQGRWFQSSCTRIQVLENVVMFIFWIPTWQNCHLMLKNWIYFIFVQTTVLVMIQYGWEIKVIILSEHMQQLNCSRLVYLRRLYKTELVIDPWMV